MPLTRLYYNNNQESCQLTIGESASRSPLATELGEIFDCVSIEKLAKEILAERTKAFSPLGRLGYPLEVMLRAYFGAFILEGIRSLSDLVKRLEDDPVFALVCGFDIRKPIPRRTTFSRLVGKLAKHQKLVDECVREITNKLKELIPDFGKILAVDCTPVRSWANPDKRQSSDPEASFIYAGRGQKRIKWVYGYRLHMVMDAIHELPIGWELTGADKNEKHMILPLLQKAREWFPWFKPEAVTADAAYDKYELLEGIVKEFDADPVIDDSHKMPLISGSPAAPYCPGNLPLVFRSWKGREKGIAYVCPERAGRAKCPLTEKCRLKYILIHPVHDYRRFGYRIPRSSPEWRSIFNKRVAAERVFSRLKEKRHLTLHCFRGRTRIALHVSLAILTTMAMALSRAQAGKLDEIRVCGRKIG